VRTSLITKKPFILKNGSPKPFIEYRLDESNNLGNSKTGHSKERFSEPALSPKNLPEQRTVFRIVLCKLQYLGFGIVLKQGPGRYE
jgi:hypothetical protein